MRRYTFEVEFDDGRVQTVQVDQRDIRRWESEEGKSWLTSDTTVTATTQIAFHAMRRVGLFTGLWDQFDTACVWVREVDTEPVDPTRKARTGGRSSSSRSARASASESGKQPEPQPS